MYNAVLTLTGTREHYAWNTLSCGLANGLTSLPTLTNANAECNMQIDMH